MPEQTQAPAVTTPAPTPQTPATGTQVPAQSQFGNAFVQEQLKRNDTGRMTWEGALGETLGGKLYELLSAQLTDAKLMGHANSAVDSAISALKKQLEGNVQVSDQEAAAMFVAQLDTSLRRLATDAVVRSGLSQGIRETVDANPYEVALAALAGAAAYVLSNQDLPLIEQKLGLGGGHSLVGGVDPGRTMKLALEQVRVGYRYAGPQLSAELNADRYQDGHGVSGGVTYKPNQDTALAATASHTDRAGEQRSRVDLSYTDPSVAANAYWQQQVGGTQPGQTIGGSVASRGDTLQRQVSGLYRSDGSWEAAAGVGKTEKDRSWAVEAFGGRSATGQEDYGVRALFKLRF